MSNKATKIATAQSTDDSVPKSQTFVSLAFEFVIKVSKRSRNTFLTKFEENDENDVAKIRKIYLTITMQKPHAHN